MDSQNHLLYINELQYIKTIRNFVVSHKIYENFIIKNKITEKNYSAIKNQNRGIKKQK